MIPPNSLPRATLNIRVPLAKSLDTYSNADVEIAATVQDLGRAPRFPDAVLRKVDDENALRHLPSLRSIARQIAARK